MSIALIVTLPFALVGLLVGRWWALAVPVAFWALYFAARLAGAFGGVGDGWQYGAAALVLVGVAYAAAGVLIRAALARRGMRSSGRGEAPLR